MFRKLLIANRGEAAVRIARAARELGISPVGVCSEADAGSAWCTGMDEVVCLGAAAPSESYLQRERVVQAALQTGCSAVHPGWGFLAEDPRFVELVRQHGLRFVGPSAELMRTMGLKAPAKAAAARAGLPVIPGSDGLLEDVDEALECARRMGYPVLLKADAGGGGRGMRRANDDGQLRDAFAEATAEATAAFGNGALYLEKYLEGGRHIEVQVLGDGFGNALHLFERECSIQRKHQKLVEESPSPALDEAQRTALGARAAEATRSLGYEGAGTIEFFRAPDEQGGELYFMEMNTRLQVEHPITECVTGIDIVHEQLKVAANGRLALTQDAITIDGHAIECRINAEDPSADFRPSPGRVEAFEIGRDGGPGTVRVDTHLAAGERVPPFYDSLLCKVIAHAPTRDEAIETLARALRNARIEGVATTLPLALAVLESEAFRRGKYDTRSIPGWPAQTAPVAS